MECHICFDTKDDFIKLECRHELCLSCYQSVLKFHAYCPFCRYQIEPEQIIIADISDIEDEFCYKRWCTAFSITILIGTILNSYVLLGKVV